MADLNANLNNNDLAQAGSANLVGLGYSQPKLTAYGDVRDLTEAGAGSLNEGSAMVAMMRFP